MVVRRSLRFFILSLVLASSFFLTGKGVAAAASDLPLPVARWTVYLGVLGNSYVGNYLYEGNFQYMDGINRRAASPSSNMNQNGYSWGGQAGATYHLVSPYFFGFSVAAMSNSRNAESTFLLNAANNGNFNTYTNFRVTYNIDTMLAFGIDVTPQTHVYLKGGASYAELRQNFQVLLLTSFPDSLLAQRTHTDLWGYVAGLGLAYDLTRWLSLFSEYDYYNYGYYNLNTIHNIFSNVGAATSTDVYNQNVRVQAYTVRFGLNVNFAQ